IRRGARVKIFAAGQVGDRLERLLIEAHAHGPALKADGLSACGADSDSEDAYTALGGHAGSLDGVGPRGSLAVGEYNNRRGCVGAGRNRREDWFFRFASLIDWDTARSVTPVD